MFNQEILTEMFKGKEFGYGKWFLYFYAEDKFHSEEEALDIEILDGVIKLTQYAQDKVEGEGYIRSDEPESVDYIPFERIIRISFGKDF